MNVNRGILPALVTPFDADGVFAAGSFERLLEQVYAADVDGVYVCGQTGEGLLQPAAQRKCVAEVAVRNSPPGKTVIVNIGAYTTADAVDLARHAARAGVHAISSLPPAGNYSFDEIRAYYQAIASASDLPLLVYYFPELCPALANTGQLLELCSIPNVIGLKFTDFDLYKLSLLKREGAIVFNGRDEVLAAGLLMGADGGIGSFYNLVPDLFVTLFRHSEAGEWEQAREAQQRINELISISLRFPVFPAIKVMLAWSGIPCGTCLPPRRPLTPAEESCLQEMLGESSLSDRAFSFAAR
ncbi:MAG: dihydrodipicolinate synthase family protein [Bryobacteraceae bacterium]|nr:dihydrodipicolinate synthase family protein [Bryobacteraceae bacterium]